jgi:cyclopropane-fatty-acyl-phospholipid synthase
MLDTLIARGILPDTLIRLGIKNLLKERLKEIQADNLEREDHARTDILKELKVSPIAVETDAANDQHYQLPADFFQLALGPNLKYSCALWSDSTGNLKEAEEAMLDLTCSRAQLQDGQDILELGCGWGSLTLYMAKKFPNSKITAVSNASNQREFILNKAKNLNLNNIRIITQNMISFSTTEKFDRIVSVEMFEHMRNHEQLINRIAGWLKPEGKLFVHIFVHKNATYKFEIKDDTDWMSKYFFSGGIMPSEHYFYYLNLDLKLNRHWCVSGTHYAKTARAWLENMDDNLHAVERIFDKHYGPANTQKWINYWRIFFMSCEELWNYRNGKEWFVAHYLFEKSQH